MKPLSVDLRERLARYVLAGHSGRQAAKVFGISKSSANRFVAQMRTKGNVQPERQGGDRRGKVKHHREYILARVKAVPDLTLQEIVYELNGRGLQIHLSNVARFLIKEGITFKKNSGRQRTEPA